MTRTSPTGRRAFGRADHLARLGDRGPAALACTPHGDRCRALHLGPRHRYPRQATDRRTARISVRWTGGEHLWWFADATVTSGAAGCANRSRRRGLPALAPASRRRIRPGWQSASGVVVAGRSTDAGTTIHLVREGYDSSCTRASTTHSSAGCPATSRCLCLAHAERATPGTARCGSCSWRTGRDRRALGRTGPGPHPLRFRADQGRHRAAVNHERHGAHSY